MLLDSWNQLLLTVPWPLWLPRWSLALVLPIVALLCYGLFSLLVPLLVPSARRPAIRLLFWRTRLPIQLILAVALSDWTLRSTQVSADVIAVLNRAVPLVLVGATAVLAYRMSTTFFIALRRRFNLNTPDNLKARRATTQLIVLERLVGIATVVIAVAVGLMTIPEVRRYGTSLLASAGVAGIVVGFAAQQTIANVLAGIQIAITQPLRIDDAVVIDGEWGWIDEITLTYIVVRIWDKRRLMVPISYLLQKPFQNWTRSTSSIIGTVSLHVDYTLDVEALRTEQSRILAGHDKWDGQVDVVQVVDTTESTMVVRSLVSAADSPSTWDLRCDVRERLIQWVRVHHPESLPRERLRITGTVRSAL